MFRITTPFRVFGNRKTRKTNRTIKLEQLEGRLLCTANTLDGSLGQAEDYYSQDALVSFGTPGEVGRNARPALATPISIRGGSTGSNAVNSRIVLSVRGSDDGGERNLKYEWTVISQPTGSNTQITVNNSNRAKSSALIVDKVGKYRIQLVITDAEGKSVRKLQNVKVIAVAKSFELIDGNEMLKSGSTITTTAKSQRLRVQAYDQFGDPMRTPSSTNWTLISSPSGSSPTFRGRSSSGSIRFDQAGRYAFQISDGSARFRGYVNVQQELKKVYVSVNTSTIEPGQRAKFTVSGTDQFKKPMLRLPSAEWTATRDAPITSSGLFTAPDKTGTYRAYASIGSLTGKASIKVAVIPIESDILNLTQTYFADGSISRADMMSILRSAGDDGVVNSLELTEMRSVVASAADYNMPDYVRVLASNVVNTNPANSKFQGSTLGNLTVGSDTTKLNNLVNKWFVGADLPALMQVSGVGTIAYASASGVLFNGNASFSDQSQGLLGDCYLVSGLGSLARVNTDAVENMFIDNGDGTFTVRFYSGTLNNYSSGFTTGTGVADYVTVDTRLPAYGSGQYFAYSNFQQSISNSSNALWLALAEKAYAQWNETGRAGQNGQNSYAGIEGGWMGIVYAQVLGYNSTNYSVASSSTKNVLINALNSNYATTIGTKSNAPNLVTGHAYTVTGYDVGTDKFTLYNPWGTTHPAGPMSWEELMANCDFVSLIDPSGTIPPSNGGSGGGANSGFDWSFQFNATPPVTSEQFAATEFSTADNLDVVWTTLPEFESDIESDEMHDYEASLADASSGAEGEVDATDSFRTERDMLFDFETIDSLIQEALA